MALAATSIGMATHLLHHSGQSDTAIGSLMTVAAMIDDVLALLALAVLNAVLSDDVIDFSSSPAERAWTIMKPIVVSLSFIVGGVLCSFGTARGVVLLSALKFVSRYPTLQASATGATMLACAAAMAVGAHYAGTTFLLGPFVVGMAFAPLDDARAHFSVPGAAGVHDWLAKLFFASIGFVIRCARSSRARPLELGFC